MPFTIRIEFTMYDTVEKIPLEAAVRQAAIRYPYFSVRVIKDGGEYLAVPNPAPIPVYPGPEVLPLGSEALGYHLFAVSYEGRRLYFYTSHVITDGAGLIPMIRTILYYYICARHGVTLDPAGISLADSPMFDDEICNPYPEEKMADAVPIYDKTCNHFFRLRDGGFVNDDHSTVYRFRLSEQAVMDFNHDHDGSPCTLMSVLMAKAIWSLHPEITQDLVSAVSFNMRPGLGNRHNYRMLCRSIPMFYPAAKRNLEISRLCTCTRGMVTLHSQPENVLYYAQQRRERFEALESIPGLADKKALIGRRALADSVNNTFSVSYVGTMGLGSTEPYVESVFNLTDGSTYRSIFIEIANIGDWFDIAFLQGFSSDVYYRAFLQQLTACGLTYTEMEAGPLLTPKLQLP